MDSFDFARIARTMRALQWDLASADNSILDMPHIRSTVRSYARRAITQAHNNTGHQPGRDFIDTGGFHIEAFSQTGTLTCLHLRFTMTVDSTMP